MDKNIYDLASEDTRLSRKSRGEYAGPCPNPACRCQTDGFVINLSKNGGTGGFMCRGCWDTKNPPIRPDRPRWGDLIDYCRHFRHMSFSDAQAAARDFLNEQVEDALSRVDRFAQVQKTPVYEPPAQVWQDKNHPQVQAAAARIWTPDGAPVLDYIHARGLNDETIRAVHLGAVHSSLVNRLYWARIEVETWFLVIPWYIDGSLWQIELRDIRPDCPQDKRYRSIAGSGNGLYLADCLKAKRPTFLVEGAIDALIIAQEAGDIANVVATGSTDGAQIGKWTMRLSRMPVVFVAFDHDHKGDEKSAWWLERLAHKSPIRFRPTKKDAGEMHLLKPGLVRAWAEVAVETWQEHREREDATPELSAPVSGQTAVQDATRERIYVDTPIDDQAALCCSVCGLSIEQDTDTLFHFDADGILYCGLHGPNNTATPEQDASDDHGKDAAPSGLEQFAHAVSEIVTVLGPDTRIERLEPGLSLKEWLARQGRLPEQQDSTPVTLPALPRTRCPHERLEERVQKVPGSVSTFKYLKRLPCSEKPGQSGFCSEHEPVSLLLSLAHKLNYPALPVNESLTVLSGVANWEEFAVRSMAQVPLSGNRLSEQRIKRVLPRLKRMLDERERTAQDAREREQQQEADQVTG